ILEVIEEPQKNDEAEPVLARETEGVDDLVDHFERVAELAAHVPRLRRELGERLDQDAVPGAALHHLNGEVAGVSSDIEHRPARQVLGDVRLDKAPARLGAVSRRLPAARHDSAGQLETLIPPAELAHLALDLLAA